MKSLRPLYQSDLADWLEKQAGGLSLEISTFDDRFDKWAKQCGWQLDETPDGPI
jgi:hypothetical protein